MMYGYQNGYYGGGGMLFAMFLGFVMLVLIVLGVTWLLWGSNLFKENMMMHRGGGPHGMMHFREDAALAR